MSKSVLGCGRWGGFIAWYLAKNCKNKEVFSWGPSSDKIFQTLKQSGKNEYLTMPSNVVVTDNLKDAISSEMIIISISSQHLRSFAKKLNEFDLQGKTFVLAMKGLEQGSGLRLTQVFRQEIKQNINLAIWVGPGHVQSFVKNIPNCMVICSTSLVLTKSIVNQLESSLIRFYFGDDLLGNEIGAAAKNVMGIAAGMLDGMGIPALKGALMARGANEISNLIATLGGNRLTAYGLCHLGDYEATLFSQNSHNRRFGEMFVGEKMFQKLAEGVATSGALLDLAKTNNVDIPITKMVHSVINGNQPYKTAIHTLFERPLKSEF